MESWTSLLSSVGITGGKQSSFLAGRWSRSYTRRVGPTVEAEDRPLENLVSNGSCVSIAVRLKQMMWGLISSDVGLSTGDLFLTCPFQLQHAMFQTGELHLPASFSLSCPLQMQRAIFQTDELHPQANERPPRLER